MTTAPSKIGLGGGCHWCTEGVFESLLGISKVNQGWIASNGEHSNFSEAIEVHFDPAVISLSVLIEIHLYTHASTSNHSMRGKYRSAIYAYDDNQFNQSLDILKALSADFDDALVTQVYAFKSFKPNKLELTDYFYSAPDRPFCQTYIQPKLKLLLARFNRHVDHEKMSMIGLEL
ncbi:MAG: peptide-methionine (S)-S-oxide reductase [Paraglaciecola sp.]|jgi:peptide-methionine (S)-S-oxide reductase